MAKIFISYAREDYDAAKRLYDFLVSQGQEPWLDKEDILPGQKWEPAILSAIRDSHFFLAILSPNSVEKRGYIQKELRVGLDVLDQVPDTQIFLIPVRIGDCQPTHERLRAIQWVDLFPDWEDGLRRLGKVFSFIPEQVSAPNVSNTKWHVNQSLKSKQWNFILREDSVLEYEKSGRYFSNGTWRQSGDILYIEINQNYSQYKGIIKGDKIVEGEAQNIAGSEWTWEATKIED